MVARYFLLLFLIFNLSLAQAVVPTDKVLGIDVQIQLYRKAYIPHNRADFNPETTRVPGLVPLMRMGYSYTNSLIPADDRDRHRLLDQFWTETERTMGEAGLTIRDFKVHNLRLAFLTANGKFALFTETVPFLNRLKTNNAWHRLSNYNRIPADGNSEGFLKVKPFPFCFEAVLYHPKGEIGLKAFLDAYTDPELPLGLSAFYDPAQIPAGKGHHAGYVSDPASFLAHDFAHWEGFVSEFTDEEDSARAIKNKVSVKTEKWKAFQHIMSSVLNTEKTPSRYLQGSLFFLPHEVGFDTGPEVVSSPGSPSMFSSHSAVFKAWINEAIKDVRDDAEVEKPVIETALANIQFSIKGISIEVGSVIPSEESPDICKTTLAFSYKDGNFLCLADANVRFIPSTSDPNKESVIISDLAFKAWDEDSIKNMNNCWCWCRTTAASVRTSIIQALTTKTFPALLNRTNQFNAVFWDKVVLYNWIIGKKVLTRKSSKAEMVGQYTALLREFYKKYAPLFQDQEKPQTSEVTVQPVVSDTITNWIGNALYKINESLPVKLYIASTDTIKNEAQQTLTLPVYARKTKEAIDFLSAIGQVIVSVDTAPSGIQDYSTVTFHNPQFTLTDEDAPKRISTCCRRITRVQLADYVTQALTDRAVPVYEMDGPLPLDDLDKDSLTDVKLEVKEDHKEHKEPEKAEEKTILPGASGLGLTPLPAPVSGPTSAPDVVITIGSAS